MIDTEVNELKDIRIQRLTMQDPESTKPKLNIDSLNRFVYSIEAIQMSLIDLDGEVKQ